jgi:chorismate mutase
MQALGKGIHYGMFVTVSCCTSMQALSKRIHYGMFVAEAKFRESPDEYSSAIRAQDAEALLATLTFPQQEAAVVARVRGKAATFGQDLDSTGQAKNAQYKVEPELVAELYEKWVMPLTKEVQVKYLLRRLDDIEAEQGST